MIPRGGAPAPKDFTWTAPCCSSTCTLFVMTARRHPRRNELRKSQFLFCQWTPLILFSWWVNVSASVAAQLSRACAGHALSRGVPAGHGCCRTKCVSLRLFQFKFRFSAIVSVSPFVTSVMFLLQARRIVWKTDFWFQVWTGTGTAMFIAARKGCHGICSSLLPQFFLQSYSTSPEFQVAPPKRVRRLSLWPQGVTKAWITIGRSALV